LKHNPEPVSKEIIVAQTDTHRGSQVGNYMGQPIFQTIESTSGTYVFDRIAKSVDGEFPLEQLNKDELLIKPGLIYRPKG
jgi:hypothetical protein